jgi:hypothetical protein
MAYFASQESTLLANTAQTFNFNKVMGGFGAQTLVYINDDGAKTHTLSLDTGSTFTVKPGEQRVLTGMGDSVLLTIGGDANSTGPYRLAASSELEPPIIKQ